MSSKGEHFRGLMRGIQGYLHGLAMVLDRIDADEPLWIGLLEESGREVWDECYSRQRVEASCWEYTLAGDVTDRTEVPGGIAEKQTREGALLLSGPVLFRTTAHRHAIWQLAIYEDDRAAAPFLYLPRMTGGISLSPFNQISLNRYSIDLEWVRRWSVRQGLLELSDDVLARL